MGVLNEWTSRCPMDVDPTTPEHRHGEASGRALKGVQRNRNPVQNHR